MEHTKLHRTWRFWLALLIPTLIATVVAYLIYTHGNYITCFSAECFNFTFETYKVPISIFALIVPALALCVATHRSEYQVIQLSKQAEINQATNFFKHREMIIEKLKDIEKRRDIEFISYELAYEHIFNDNSPLNVSYKPTNTIFESYKSELMEYLSFIDRAILNNENLDPKTIPRFIERGATLNCYLYKCSEKHKSLTNIKIPLDKTSYKKVKTSIPLLGLSGDVLLHFEIIFHIARICSINKEIIEESRFNEINQICHIYSEKFNNKMNFSREVVDYILKNSDK